MKGIYVQLVRKEYQEHITPAMRIALALATFTIVVGGPVGAILFVYLKGFGLPADWRRPIGFLILLAPISGLITIALVNITLAWRYRNDEHTSNARSREQVISTASRADKLKAFAHTTFVYPQAMKSSLKIAISLSIGMMVFFSAMFLLHQNVKRLVVEMVVSLFAFLLYLLTDRMSIRYQNDDYISLTTEGVKFRANGEQGLIPWDSVQKIQRGRDAHLIKSHNKDIIVWNNIEPAQKPQKEKTSYVGLLKLDVSDPYVVVLMRQINTMNPSVGYLPPKMSKTFQHTLAFICLILITGIVMTVILNAF